MAIELTTASNNVIDSIRESLSAIGSDNIKKILDITRSNYNLLTPNPNTLYVINEGVGVNRSLLLGTSRIDFSGSIVGNLSATGLVYAAGGNSTTWNSTANIININSAKWNSNSTTVSVNSAYWIGSSTIVAANSGNWISNGGDSKGSNLTIGTNDNYNLNLETAGSTKLTVSNNGSVGINSLNPSSKLEIFDTSLANSGSLNGSGLYLAQAWNTTGSPVALKLNITNTNSGSASKLIDLRVSEASKFNVNATGNVGIGNSQPVSKVDIYDNTTAIDLSGAALNILHVWNAPLIDITAIKLNVSSSNSGANSKLLDLQIGGSSYFSVNKAGNVSTIGNLSARTFTGLDTTITGTQFNWAAGTSFFKSLTSNTTFTFSNAQPGQEIVVAVYSPLTSYNITWPTVTWPGAVIPTQSTADQTDVYTFKNIGNIIYGAVNRSSRLSEDAGVIYVKNWTQLQAALTAVRPLSGGTIYIDGVIEIPPYTGGDWNNGGLTIFTPNLVITGPSNGSSVLKLQSGVNYNSYNNFVININTSNITIENITIQGITNLFKAAGAAGEFLPSIPAGIHIARGANSIGISNNLGISNITIRNVTFKELASAIFISGAGSTGGSAPIFNASGPIKNLSILNNKVRNCGGGFTISWGVDELLIDGNSIIGDGAVFDKLKFSYYNPIWVGKGISNARIVNNYCADHQRIGIEVFFPFANTSSLAQGRHPVSYGQNGAGFIVANNTVKNMGSMGISFTGARNSVVSNNTIIDCGDIGLELVGDDENMNTQRPDRVVNVLCIGNTIKNVRGAARRPNLISPTDTDYGYSAIPLNPNSAVVTTQFSNRVPLVGTTAFSTGTKTFTFTGAPKIYPEFAMGKEVQLKLAVDPNYIMTGVVTANDNTTIEINIPVGGLNTGTLPGPYSVLLCPYGLHTLNLTPSQLEWSANEGKVNNIDIPGSTIGTFLAIQGSGGSSERNIYFLADLRSYVVGASTCSVYIKGSGPGVCDQKTSWIAQTRTACMGMTIDQVNGAKVIGNTIDLVLDSNSSERYGCQIIRANNVIFENNLISRAGTRYLMINISNHVIVKNNVFRSGSTLMERDPVTQSITKLGEDVTWPENSYDNASVPRPSGLYAIYNQDSPEYNASLPYSNCRYLVKDNTFVPVSGVNTLRPYVNGAAIFSDQFSRPETAFNAGIDLKHNNFTDGYDVTVDFPSPVLDYSQKWNNTSATSPFIGYRFHADTTLSPDSSRIFDIASGDETYLYLKSYTSATSNNISTGSKTFTITSPSLATFQLATIPAGTFVRCVVGTSSTGANFVEGRVTTTVSPGANSFTMLVTNTGGSGTSITSWNIIFDTSVFFVDKLSKLNLRSDVVLDYHTGTKIGTAATQKLGFWNATPAAQPATVAKATDANSVIAQLNTLIDRLSSIGILAP